ncbi:MAG: WhiB family transcriptional regulator [Actinobacteria bacterium]|nr:WhiB family transcriptional regulator [Actinomycetota bacterium]
MERKRALRGNHPTIRQSVQSFSTAAGRALCARCLVSRQCLDLALSTAVEFGIFGGTSPRERRCLTTGGAAGRHS